MGWCGGSGGFSIPTVLGQTTLVLLVPHTHNKTECEAEPDCDSWSDTIQEASFKDKDQYQPIWMPYSFQSIM